MSALPPVRQLLAAPILAVLTLLSVTFGSGLVLADDGPRECLLREADQLFRKLATSIAAAEIDPATIDDAYVNREGELVIERCSSANGQLAPGEGEAFRTHMARWSYHLDHKLQEITTRGTSD